MMISDEPDAAIPVIDWKSPRERICIQDKEDTFTDNLQVTRDTDWKDQEDINLNCDDVDYKDATNTNQIPFEETLHDSSFTDWKDQEDANLNCKDVDHENTTHTYEMSLEEIHTNSLNMDQKAMRCTDQGDDEDIHSRNHDTSAKNFDKSITCCEKIDGPKFFKGCKWSPDNLGNRILTCDGNNRLTIYHAFLNKLDYKSSQISDDRYELRNIGNVYDFQWYPLASVSQYLVVVATSLGPIHIYDASTSQSVASYQMYSTNDEVVRAHSVACVADGTRLISGTADYLFLFDVNKPGRTYERIMTRPNFNRGIISTIAVHPDRYSMFAVGTYNHRIGIYDDQDLLCVLHGHDKGITHLKFSPDGLLLYSGTRGDGDIICWDLRNPGTALYKLRRVVTTQQRIYFDITSNSRYILSGSTTGDVYIWDSLLPPTDTILPPVHTFQAHQDCTNGLSVHSQLSFVATVSGQYHYSQKIDEEDNDMNKEETSEYTSSQENSLKLWHLDL